MAIVRSATLCDHCGARSEEYTAWASCKECMADVCDACIVPGTKDDESGRAQCRKCQQETMRAVLGLKPGQEARVYDGTQPVIEVRGDRSKWDERLIAERCANLIKPGLSVASKFMSMSPCEAAWEMAEDCSNKIRKEFGLDEPEWEAPEPECECVPVDVDMVDNSSCQVHGVR